MISAWAVRFGRFLVNYAYMTMSVAMFENVCY